MGTRVEEEAARKAAEANRLNEKIQKDVRDTKAQHTNREQFGKLVKAGQQTQQSQTQTTKGKAEKAQTETRQGEQVAQKSVKEGEAQERAARMARGGIQQQSKAMEQARSFNTVLANQTTDTRQADTGRVDRRDQGKVKDRVEKEDREVEVKQKDAQKELEAETARIEAREQAHVNSAIDANAGGGDSDGRGRDDGGAAIAGMQKASQMQAKQAQAPQAVKQIPPEMLEKLVSAVYLGVNEKGLKEFQIELKDGPLKGAFMRVSAEDGKVALRFEGLDANTKRLLEASKGDLMKRLGAKGLSLAKLEVK